MTSAQKISLGYLMGLYSKQCRLELDAIRAIRNLFAHGLEIHSFDIPAIRDRCANLRIWERISIKGVFKDDKNDDSPEELQFFDRDDLHKPAVQYVTAVRCYLAVFSLPVRQKFSMEEPPF